MLPDSTQKASCTWPLCCRCCMVERLVRGREPGARVCTPGRERGCLPYGYAPAAEMRSRRAPASARLTLRVACAGVPCDGARDDARWSAVSCYSRETTRQQTSRARERETAARARGDTSRSRISVITFFNLSPISVIAPALRPLNRTSPTVRL